MEDKGMDYWVIMLINGHSNLFQVSPVQDYKLLLLNIKYASIYFFVHC